MLVKDPSKRIGAKRGLEEVKEHSFCDNINWEDIYNKKCTPPIKINKLKSNFDHEYTSIQFNPGDYCDDNEESNIADDICKSKILKR